MRIFACGDINAKSGREAVKKYFRNIILSYNIDFCIANVDNVAHGLGVIEQTLNEILINGADVCTGGNHLYDKKEIVPFLKENNILLKPLNYTKYMVGSGYVELVKNNKKYVVIHLAGQCHMPQTADNPFIVCDNLLERNHYKLGETVNAIVVDFHAETTAEKVALGHYLDGRVSFVFGTHTHVPTADAHLLEFGTAYITDLGMTGDYNSVIGVKKSAAVQSFIKQADTEHFSPTTGDATLCGAIVEIDDISGLAKSIKQIKVGGVLGD